MDWGMLGHQWAVDMLAEHVVKRQVRHAYLFTGPPGIGRRTLALRLAQALNCPTPVLPGQPCGVCPTCARLGRLQHPDLSVVQAEQEGGTLKVEQVRELQHTLSLAPYEASYRVALLLRFEEAHPSAANALLKTLEEPPAQVIMILTAESVERLLPTIVSRCEVIHLRLLPLEEANRGLHERWGLPVEQARLLAHVSGGCPGYALRLHEQPDLLAQRRSWLDDLATLLAANRRERFAYASSLKDDKDAMRAVLQVWLSFWRDVFLRTSGAAVPLTNLDYTGQIHELAEHCSLAKAQAMVASLVRTLEGLDRNVNARLALEVLLLDLPRIPASFSVKDD